MDRYRLVGALLAAAAACGYGTGPLLAKVIYPTGLDWLGLLFWRFLIGALLLWMLVLLVPSNRAGLRALTRRRVVAILGLGMFFVANAGTYFAGLMWISASLASLIIYIYPALVAVLSLRWGHGLQGRRPWLALAVVMVGVALTIGGIETRAEPIGIVLLIVSPCCYAVYIVLSARFAGERRGVTATDRVDGEAVVPPVVMAAVMLIGTSALTTAMAVAAGEPVLPWLVPAAAWPGLFGIAAVTTFAITAFYAGSARIGAANAAVVATVEPVWTVSLAVILLGESLGPVQLVGGALVLGGVLLAQTTPGAVVDAVHEEP